jgi:hypothetical protein
VPEIVTIVIFITEGDSAVSGMDADSYVTSLGS